MWQKETQSTNASKNTKTKNRVKHIICHRGTSLRARFIYRLRRFISHWTRFVRLSSNRKTLHVTYTVIAAQFQFPLTVDLSSVNRTKCILSTSSACNFLPITPKDSLFKCEAKCHSNALICLSQFSCVDYFRVTKKDLTSLDGNDTTVTHQGHSHIFFSAIFLTQSQHNRNVYLFQMFDTAFRPIDGRPCTSRKSEIHYTKKNKFFFYFELQRNKVKRKKSVKMINFRILCQTQLNLSSFYQW